MSNDAVYYFSVLLEEIRDEVKALYESLAGVRQKAGNQPTRAESSVLAGVVKAIRQALTSINYDIARLDQRITRLEAV